MISIRGGTIACRARQFIWKEPSSDLIFVQGQLCKSWARKQATYTLPQFNPYRHCRWSEKNLVSKQPQRLCNATQHRLTEQAWKVFSQMYLQCAKMRCGTAAEQLIEVGNAFLCSLSRRALILLMTICCSAQCLTIYQQLYINVKWSLLCGRLYLFNVS